MIVTPLLLLALFIRSCFDPPFFSLSCSARGRVRPVVCSPAGEGWAGPGEDPGCGASTAHERDFCWEKGRGGSGKKERTSRTERASLFKQTCNLKNKQKSYLWLNEGRRQWRWREMEGKSVTWAVQLRRSGSLRWGRLLCLQPRQRGGGFGCRQSSWAAQVMAAACLGETLSCFVHPLPPWGCRDPSLPAWQGR